MTGDSARVQELELELRNLRIAFEEYIGSSRELEDGLDRELADMHGKLAQSSAANEMLGAQMANMEPLIRNLETSLEVTKKKLIEEVRMRRQAELAQVEIETRYKEAESNMVALREENENLRDECGALHEELSFKCRELEDFKVGQKAKLKQLDELSQIIGSSAQRREERSTTGSTPGTGSRMNETTENTLNTKSDTNMDDSYAEVLDELETVTEQLISTQQKLWKTEDKLRESDARVRELNYKLSRRSSSGILRSSDVGKGGKRESSIDFETEKRLLADAANLRDELSKTQEELRAAEEQAASYQEKLNSLRESNLKGAAEHKYEINELRGKINDLKDSLKDAQEQVMEYEDLLEENREENARLFEEISCLRDLIPERERSISKHAEYDEKREKAMEQLKKEIARKDEAVEELKVQIMQQDDELGALKAKVSQNEVDLENSKKKIISKEDEVAELKKTLKRKEEQVEELRETITQETRASVLQQAQKEREREINVLREKFKKIFKENATLRQQVETLENSLPRKEELSALKEDNARLSTMLKNTREKHKSAILETETSWRKKLEKVTADTAEMREDVYGETNKIVESLEKDVRSLSEEKYYLQEKVKSLERVLQSSRQEKDRFNQKSKLMESNLNSAREEILKLKKKTGYLAAELENSKSLVSKLDREGDKLRIKYASAKAELDVSRMILEETGLEEETVQREDTIEMRQKIISLSDSLDTIKQDYNELLSELEESRKRFCDLQEESVKRSEDQMHRFKNQIEELEEALENSRRERAELVRELEIAESKYGANDPSDAVTKKESQIEERRLVMDKFEAINEEKISLERRLRDANATIESLEGTLSSLRTELRECQADLMDSKAENLKLKDETENLRNENATGVYRMRAVERLLSDSPRNREARDPPDPVEEVKQANHTPIRTNLDPFDVMQRHSPTRDPPTTRSVANSIMSGKSEGSDSFGVLRSQLAELTRENDVLKSKVVSLATKVTSRETDEFSSKEEINKLQEQISALQICLENAENRSVEVDNLERQLERAQAKLQEKETTLLRMEKDLELSKQHSDALMVEISTLNDALKETRQNLGGVKEQVEELKWEKADLQKQVDMKDRLSTEEARRIVATERVEEFDEIKSQLRKLTEEKSALQHQLDDAKIALSVSQYAQERNKEERRECANKLEMATEDIYALKTEMSKLEYAATESRRKYEEATRELQRVRTRSQLNIDSKSEADALAKELQILSDEKIDLQRMVRVLEEELKRCKDELEQKCEAVRSLENSLVSTQDETRMLTEELSHLSSAFEEAKNEYDAVVDELEAVNELFDEARQEAERSGREAAAEEIRSEMQIAQEKERELMKEQMNKILDENVELQKKLMKTRKTNIQSSESDVKNEEIELAKQEVDILREALRSSSEQVKLLKEKEFNLTLSLTETKEDLKQAQDELETMIHKFTQEQNSEPSDATIHSSAESSIEYQSLREHFRRLIETCEHADPTLSISGVDSEYKAEGLRLKVELMDMSMSLDKLMKENALIEEELVRLKSTSREMCAEAERQGKLSAMKEVRAELKSEREREMKEFKDKFNELVLENTALEKKAQEATIALEIAKVSQDRKIEELNSLEDELAESKKEMRKFKEEIFNLTVELERSKNNRGQSQKAVSADQDAKVKALNRQLNALNIENKSLLTKLRLAETSLKTNQSTAKTTTDEVETLMRSLEEARMTVGKLEEKVLKLNAEIDSLRKDNGRLSDQRAKLLAALEQAEANVATKNTETDGSSHFTEKYELDFLRSQLAKYAEEKADLQKQIDVARVNLSLSKYSNGQMEQDLATKNTLSSLEKELMKARSERVSTAEVLKQMSDALESIEGTLSSDDDSETGLNYVGSKSPKKQSPDNVATTSTESLQERAADIKYRLSALASAILKVKIDHVNALSELETAKEKLRATKRESSYESNSGVHRSITPEKEGMKALREQLKLFFAENASLEKKITHAQEELRRALETVEKQKIELELYEVKYNQCKKESSQSKAEASKLRHTLEGAQRDHRTLREQLEQMNMQVGKLCKEAEERGKAAAAEELRVGIRTLKEQERKELLDQFNMFYKENLALQDKLDKTESALAASLDAQTKHETELKKIEIDARSRYEKATAKAEELESINKRLNLELDSLKDDLEIAKTNRDAVVRELESVKRRLEEASEEVKRDTNLALGSRSYGTGRDAELRLLQDQFKKLSAKSVALGQKVEEAESAVATVRNQQDKTKRTTESHTRLAEKLKAKIEKVADDSKRKDEEIEELSVMMESRVSLTEENVKKLEQEISVAKGTLRVSHAGLTLMQQEKGKYKGSVQRFSLEGQTLDDENDSKQREGHHASLSTDRPSCESRDDDDPIESQNIKRTRAQSPPSKTTQAALDALESGKQKAAMKKFDLKNAQKKIFGTEGRRITARTSPFAKRMAKHARRLELSRGKQPPVVTAEAAVANNAAATDDTNE